MASSSNIVVTQRAAANRSGLNVSLPTNLPVVYLEPKLHNQVRLVTKEMLIH